jgi:hypothetical protein
MWKRPISLGAWLLALSFALGGPAHGAKPDNTKKKPADPLQITVDVPKKAPTLGQVNWGRFQITVNLKNTGKKDLILWPYLSLEPLDAKGKAVERSRFIGRWGRRSTDSILEGVPFITLGPGKVHKFKFAVSGFFLDADAITGWQLPAAGEYKLVIRYQFDRAAVKKKYGSGCKDLDNAKQPWNRAHPADWKKEVKVKVKPSS